MNQMIFIIVMPSEMLLPIVNNFNHQSWDADLKEEKYTAAFAGLNGLEDSSSLS